MAGHPWALAFQCKVKIYKDVGMQCLIIDLLSFYLFHLTGPFSLSLMILYPSYFWRIHWLEVEGPQIISHQQRCHYRCFQNFCPQIFFVTVVGISICIKTVIIGAQIWYYKTIWHHLSKFKGIIMKSFLYYTMRNKIKNAVSSSLCNHPLP